MTAPRCRRRDALLPWLVLCLSLLAAGTAPAELLPDPPSFFIESIEVAGLRHGTSELVVAESLLSEGVAYTESELQQAVFRLQRLPFILEARFSLAKGSERGRYRLRITVEEIRRYFFGEDVTFTQFTNSLAFDSLDGQNFSVTPGGLAGIRFFVGSYGMVFGSVSSHGGLQAGYTQYNLFDRRAFLSVGLTTHGCCPLEVFPLGIDPTFSGWRNEGDLRESQITLGLPLRQRFQLRLQATHSYSERGLRRSLLENEDLLFRRATLDYEDLRRNQVEAALTFDSTDDPVFPSRGLSWTVALDVQDVESRLLAGSDPLFGLAVELPPGVGARLPLYRSEQLRLAFNLGQHWSLSRRQTVSLSLRLAAGRSEVSNLPIVERIEGQDCPLFGPCSEYALRLVDQEDLDVIEGFFTARHSMSLWGAAKTRERGDLRLEHALDFGYDQVSPSLSLAENPLYRKSFTSSLVFRNSWGLFRISFQIADYGRDL